MEEVDFVEEEDYCGGGEPGAVYDVVEKEECFFHLVLVQDVSGDLVV